MYCKKCGTLQEAVFGKISFRAECSKCGADLHSCVNCKFYQEGLNNDCKIPGTERIVDKTAANFCEEFAPSDQKVEIEKKDDAKKRFEDLFK